MARQKSVCIFEVAMYCWCTHHLLLMCMLILFNVNGCFRSCNVIRSWTSIGTCLMLIRFLTAFSFLILSHLSLKHTDLYFFSQHIFNKCFLEILSVWNKIRLYLFNDKFWFFKRFFSLFPKWHICPAYFQINCIWRVSSC